MELSNGRELYQSKSNLNMKKKKSAKIKEQPRLYFKGSRNSQELGIGIAQTLNLQIWESLRPRPNGKIKPNYK